MAVSFIVVNNLSVAVARLPYFERGMLVVFCKAYKRISWWLFTGNGKAMIIFAPMRTTRWLSIAAALIFIASCFLPWVVIESKNIVISGINAEGTSYGKPGYLNLFFISIVLVLSLFQKVWAVRINLFLAAFNVGWALRNFILLSACEGGECPQRQPAFFVYLVFAILLLVLVPLQKVKMPEPESANE